MLESLATFVEREAGHILLCFIVIGIGALFYVAKIPKAEDLIVFALGVLARSMHSASTPPKP